MIREFLRQQPAGEPSVEAACFGVAGPVLDDTAEMTNVSWTVDGKAVALEFGLARVRLLNDLVSIAHSVSVLHPEELHVLQAGAPNLGGNAALLAAGTGMGQSFLFNDGRHLVPAPSEGGHADFARAHAARMAARPMADCAVRPRGSRDGRVGNRPEQPLPFHAWRPPVRGARSRDAARTAESRLREGARTLVPALYRGHGSLRRSAYGAEAGNLALRTVATRGVYIGGGIAPKNIELFDRPAFLERFRQKGPMSDLLHTIPLKVILNPQAGLLGAATVANQM